MADENLAELEGRLSKMVAKVDKLASQESKMEIMALKIKYLVLDRSHRHEILSDIETFYKERNAALKKQVARLEKADESESRNWVIRYDKLLAEKKALETQFHQREKEFAQEIASLQEENKELKHSLRLEREALSLEYDHANFDKLQKLIDELEDVVKRKKEAIYGMELDKLQELIDQLEEAVKTKEDKVYGYEQVSQRDEDYTSKDINNNNNINNNRREIRSKLTAMERKRYPRYVTELKIEL